MFPFLDLFHIICLMYKKHSALIEMFLMKWLLDMKTDEKNMPENLMDL